MRANAVLGSQGATVKVAAAIAWLETLHPESEVDVTARPPISSPELDAELFRPMTAAERAREYRKRKRTVTPTVTKRDAFRDGGVRGGSVSGSDKKAEKEEKNGTTYQVDLGETVTKTVTLRDAKRDGRRWRRVPSVRQPNEQHRSIAQGRSVDFDKELAAFRDHEFAAPKLDADAAFRNWLRRATPDRHGQRDGFKGTATRLMERSARIAAEEGQQIPVFPLLGGRTR